MALQTSKLGTRYAPDTTTIDPTRAKAYAAATNDDNPAYESGKYAPPVFGVVPTWSQLLVASADVIPPEAMMMIVHGEQDMHFHHPLVPGTELSTTSEAYSIRVGNSGSRLAVKVESVDRDGSPIMTQFVTVFVRGMSDGESAGPDKPAHDFPEAARDNKVASFTVHVDDDQTFRYREASGDEMPIHLDDAFAKSVGLPGIIAHGLCTMAMCSQAVIKTVCDGDPARLTRLAVRFASNVFPGNDIDVDLYDAGDVDGGHAYAFEATSAGAVVVKNGWAEVAAS
ncbi:MAG TPA: MaoC/PaaZ C-terminal domain-containing protein [Acidimicrobiales bacterium]|jgi:acyl dehydratase